MHACVMTMAAVALIRQATSFSPPLLCRGRYLSTFSFAVVGASASSSTSGRISSHKNLCSSERSAGSWSHSMMSSSVGSLEVAQFPCLGDNYGYLIHDPKTGQTAAVDTPCGTAYKNELSKRGWTLTHILNTHHHADHTGGNVELKTEGVKVYGPAADGNIPCMDVPLKGSDALSFAGANAKVIDVGGHTLGHIAFYFPEEKTVFVGDSLFPLGCGKMFEGTPTQFWASLQRLRDLPDDTTIYCAHEYTETNAAFAMSVEPGNADLVKRNAEIKSKRSRGEPTVPSLLRDEKKTNPFLRGDVSAEIRKNVGASDDEDCASIFHKIRLGKDNFRG